MSASRNSAKHPNDSTFCWVTSKPPVPKHSSPKKWTHPARIPHSPPCMRHSVPSQIGTVKKPSSKQPCAPCASNLNSNRGNCLGRCGWRLAIAPWRHRCSKHSRLSGVPGASSGLRRRLRWSPNYWLSHTRIKATNPLVRDFYVTTVVMIWAWCKAGSIACNASDWVTSITATRSDWAGVAYSNAATQSGRQSAVITHIVIWR